MHKSRLQWSCVPRHVFSRETSAEIDVTMYRDLTHEKRSANFVEIHEMCQLVPEMSDGRRDSTLAGLQKLADGYLQST